MANDTWSNVELPPPPIPRPVIRPNSKPATTGETVTVASKMPQGILLRMWEPYEYQEPSQTGMRDVKGFRVINDPTKQWVVRGTYTASAGQAFARNNPAVAELLPGGFALTYGVPKEIWDNWLEHNKDTKMVRNGVIWAMPSMPAATQRARTDEMRAIRSGLEPVDPSKPAERLPGGRDRDLRASGHLRVSMLERNE